MYCAACDAIPSSTGACSHRGWAPAIPTPAETSNMCAITCVSVKEKCKQKKKKTARLNFAFWTAIER
jgi:hypothetical protein